MARAGVRRLAEPAIPDQVSCRIRERAYLPDASGLGRLTLEHHVENENTETAKAAI